MSVTRSRGASNVYGTFALVIGLLVWIALGAQLTLYCAEINVVRRPARLWPRSLTQPPLTEADRQVLRAGALAERRRLEEHIEVTFDTEEEASGAGGPAAARRVVTWAHPQGMRASCGRPHVGRIRPSQVGFSYEPR